jgi:hypothetical protein
MFFIVSNLDAGDDTVHKEVGTAVIMPCCHTCFKQLFFKEQLHLHPHIISFIDKPESLVSLVCTSSSPYKAEAVSSSLSLRQQQEPFLIPLVGHFIGCLRIEQHG